MSKIPYRFCFINIPTFGKADLSKISLLLSVIQLERQNGQHASAERQHLAAAHYRDALAGCLAADGQCRNQTGNQ